MANDGFNGTTFTFPSTTASMSPLTDADFGDTPAEVQLSGSTSPTHQYRLGLSDPTMTITIVGGTTVTQGTTGIATIKWFDGTTDPFANAILASKTKSGSVDNPLTTALTFRPTTT